MMKKKKKYRNIIKNHKKLNYLVVILIIIMIFTGIFFIKFGIDFEKNIKPIYSYNIQKNTNYDVLLKPNIFYADEILPSGKNYASKSIKSYNINLKYDFIANKDNLLEYNYNIIANLVGTAQNNEGQDKEVWNRKFVLLENENNIQYVKKNFEINKDISIDYDYYNNLARSFEMEYNIKINSVLKIYLNVYYNINLSNFGIKSEQVEDFIELDIPITNTVTEIKENYEKNSYKSIFTNLENNKIFCYIIGGILIAIAIIAIIIKIKNKNKNKTQQEIYENNIFRIIKYYGDLIVTVNNEPDLSNLKVMNIATLDDLVDVAEQTNNNIILYEIIKNKQSNLYVIVDKYVYIYTVSNSELK